MRSTLIDHSYVRDVVQKCATCIGPVKDAEILPAEAYVSEEFWEFEKRAIFAASANKQNVRGREQQICWHGSLQQYTVNFSSRRAN